MTDDAPWLDDRERLERLAVLLAREVDRILFDLDTRKRLLVKLWSRRRSREALLRVLDSRYYALGAERLLTLPSDLYRACDDFYRALDSFVFYARYTEDLPQTLAERIDAFAEDLNALAEPVLDGLATLVPDIALDRMAWEPPEDWFEREES